MLLIHKLEKLEPQSVCVLFEQSIHQINQLLFVLFIQPILSHLNNLVLVKPILDFVCNCLRVVQVVVFIYEFLRTFLVT